MKLQVLAQVHVMRTSYYERGKSYKGQLRKEGAGTTVIIFLLVVVHPVWILRKKGLRFTLLSLFTGVVSWPFANEGTANTVPTFAPHTLYTSHQSF